MSKGECWAANMPEKHLSFVQRKAEAAHAVAEGIRENVKKQIHKMRLVRKADRLSHKHLTLAQDEDEDKAKPEEDDEPKKKTRDLTKEKDFGAKSSRGRRHGGRRVRRVKAKK